jgi:hypothetical protein
MTGVQLFRTAASPSMDAGASPSLARSLLTTCTPPTGLAAISNLEITLLGWLVSQQARNSRGREILMLFEGNESWVQLHSLENRRGLKSH